MASLLTPSPSFHLQNQTILFQIHNVRGHNVFTSMPSCITNTCNGRRRAYESCLVTKATTSIKENILVKEPSTSGATENYDFGVVGMHHVGILCENLERSLDFYQNILGLEINEARPDDKLPYRGAWLWVGSEMIHLMELPNPDPLTGRPEHGGRDRHMCIAIRDVSKLKAILDKAGVPYTLSRSGRPAIFTRDPDANALEFTQVDA
ncbi:hypothetical protein Ancab_017960 [Ancistrocladus abbreviatus]